MAIDTLYDVTPHFLGELRMWLEDENDCACVPKPQPAGSYREIILAEPSLVAYWPMDDASGNALDASGNGHDMAPGGTPTYSQTGPFPAAPAATSIQFDGGASTAGGPPPTADAFYRYDSTLDGYVSGHTGVTVEAWVYPTAMPAAYAGIYQSADGDFTNAALQLQLRSGGNVFWQVGNTYQVDSVATLSLDQWTHILCTADSAAGGHIYFNGALVATGGNIAPVNIGLQTYIGAMQSVALSTLFFVGRICQVALYSAALDAATAVAHYNGGIGSGTTTYPYVTSLAATGSVGLNGDVTLSAGSNVTLTQAGQNIQIAAVSSSDTAVWMPLSTVFGGVPDLVWDSTDNLIPTLTPM